MNLRLPKDKTATAGLIVALVAFAAFAHPANELPEAVPPLDGHSHAGLVTRLELEARFWKWITMIVATNVIVLVGIAFKVGYFARGQSSNTGALKQVPRLSEEVARLTGIVETLKELEK